MDLCYEAIGQINNNFLNSKITLLVDRDLMKMSIDPPSLEVIEAIVATIVVCNWNARAWTLLEGMRGSWNLHILCKDNHTISLRTVLNDMLGYSSLTFVSLCLTLHHYISTTDRPAEGEIPPVPIERATCLLNHRHATKDRDVSLIWSLVCRSKIYKTSVDFWKSAVGNSPSTGFLVSSCPLLQGEYGFGWEPSRPNLLPPTAGTAQTKQYPAYDGDDSVAGFIAVRGFEATWLTCVIGRSRALPTWLRLKYRDAELGEGVTYNKGATDKLDMRSLYKSRSVIAPVLKKYPEVALLLPSARDRGGSESILFLTHSSTRVQLRDHCW